MKFLSITGLREDFDRVLDQYLTKYDFHLENALSELKNISDLRPFVEANPYKEPLNQINRYLALIDTTDTGTPTPCSMEDVQTLLASLLPQIQNLEEERVKLTGNCEALKNIQLQLQPFRTLETSISKILKFQFIKPRLGRIAVPYYGNFRKYFRENTDTLFFKCEETADYVYGVYFVPSTLANRIDAAYSSLHFEVIHPFSLLTNELKDIIRTTTAPKQSGEPEYFSYIDETLYTLDQQLIGINQKLTSLIRAHKEELLQAQNSLSIMSSHFEVRKMAAITREDEKVFFILCGWMPEKEAACFMKETEKDETLFVVFEDEEVDDFNPAPTRLKNPKIFKPFEMFIRMYGLPASNELDPTIFLALTYTFIFGAMFGDVGQGILLMIGGFTLYKVRHMDLAGIIGFAGIFSTMFGFLFGSFFGFEDVIPALWLRPVTQMSTLPFVGKLNTVFIIAIAFGMVLILITMILNIINHVRTGSGEVWFDHNGVAGLVFYAAVAAVLILYMSSRPLPATIILVLLFVIPLLLIALKEPLMNLIQKKSKLIEGGKGMYIVQTFFELFEILLSYFSNTLSFVRIGAFAVSHAAIMEVVLMLAGAENGGSPNWIVIVLGNLFVMGLEGLIVGIQVLRLEYYEMFSRFYKGTGREFTPYESLKQQCKTK